MQALNERQGVINATNEHPKFHISLTKTDTKMREMIQCTMHKSVLSLGSSRQL